MDNHISTARMRLLEEHRTLRAAALAEIPKVEALLASETRPLHRPAITWRLHELQGQLAYHELQIENLLLSLDTTPL